MEENESHETGFVRTDDFVGQAAAPFPADFVANQSQVATCSLPAPLLQKNVLAARHTTISKHALGRSSSEGVRPTPELKKNGDGVQLGSPPDLPCSLLSSLLKYP